MVNLRERLRKLQLLLKTLSHHLGEDQVIDYEVLGKALENTINLVEKYNKTKSKSKRKSEVNHGKEESELKEEMDDTGVKIWNLTIELDRWIQSIREKTDEDLSLIASLRLLAFRLLESATETKSHIKIIARLLRAATSAISSLAIKGDIDKAQELAQQGAEYQEIVNSSRPSNEEESKEKINVSVHFFLARVDLEMAKHNDSLALNFIAKATELLTAATIDTYQLLVAKCWSVSQIIKAPGSGNTEISTLFTTLSTEWFHQALTIMEKVINLGLDTPDIEELHIALLKAIAQEQISVVSSNDPQSFRKATNALENLIKKVDPQDLQSMYEARFLQIHLLSKQSDKQREDELQSDLMVVFQDLMQMIDWTEDTITEIFAQVSYLSVNYPNLPIHATQVLLNHALVNEEGQVHIGRIVYEAVLFARQALQTAGAYQPMLSMLNSVHKSNAEQSIDSTTIKAVQMLLVNIASRLCNEPNQLGEAGRWYWLATHPSLKSAGQNNMSRCTKKAILCHIKAGILQKANNLIATCPNTEASTHYLKFLLAEKQGNVNGATFAVVAMMTCPDFRASHLRLIICCAEHRAASSSTIAALQALLRAIQQSDLQAGFQVASLTVIRCLIQVSGSQFDNGPEPESIAEKVVEYLDLAIHKLGQHLEGQCYPLKAISWLYKSGYNLALQGLAVLSPITLANLFDRSAQLMAWYKDLNCPQINPDLNRTRASAMFTCFCGQIFHWQSLTDDHEKSDLRNLLLRYHHNVQTALSIINPPKTAATVLMRGLLSVYRLMLLFDAREWEEIEHVISAPDFATNSSNNAFRIPELALTFTLDYPDCPPAIIHQLLSVLLWKSTITKQQEVNRFAVWTHAIVIFLLHQNRPESQNEALRHMCRTLQVLRTTIGSTAYPPDETQWLLATSWNQGLKEYRHSHFENAKRWCGLCVNLAKCMPEGVTDANKLQRKYLQMFGSDAGPSDHGG